MPARAPGDGHPERKWSGELVPLVSPIAWSHSAVRLVVALCAFTLLATAVVGSTQPVVAADVGGQISLNRSGQLYAESAMRTQDGVIVSLKAQRKDTKKALKQVKRTRARYKARLKSAESTLSVRIRHLAEVDALHEYAAEAPDPEQYQARLKKLRQRVRMAQRHKQAMARGVRVYTRAIAAKRARLNSLGRARRAAIARRESAEATLAARIVQMTRLAAVRAESESTVTLSGAGSFSWPTTGRISQVYGCTGYPLNPRRGSCRHFHDGIDIVDAYGTPVRAVAVGVVAYVGWNPWDEGGRAWIVVVVHPDGYVSRYGHMIATQRVRAGEVVHTGQVIGKMGNTGRSTGTHLHFELLRGGKDVNPLGYLPAGAVKIRVDKTTTRQGAAAKAKAQKAKARKKAKALKAKARRKARKLARVEARAAAQQAAVEAEACEAAASTADEGIFDILSGDASTHLPVCPAVDVTLAEPSPGAKLAVKSSATSPAKPAANRVRPGIPLPPRGTSPVPS